MSNFSEYQAPEIGPDDIRVETWPNPEIWCAITSMDEDDLAEIGLIVDLKSAEHYEDCEMWVANVSLCEDPTFEEFRVWAKFCHQLEQHGAATIVLGNGQSIEAEEH